MVVVVCQVTSAVKLYIAKDYSTDGFLQVWSQHRSDWGDPDLVYSDRGSQLVSAAGGLDPQDEEDPVNWQEVGEKTGVKWLFTPANSQWRNGKSEAIVKCMKTSLRTTYKHLDMNYFDFMTSLKEISFILNSRPIELMLGSYSNDGGGQEETSNLPDTFTAITPNDLLIGSGLPSSERTNFHPGRGPKRLEYLESRLAAWHMTWIDACQDRLFKRDSRWVQKTKNLEVGDVVWILMDSKIQKRMKWGIVRTVFPDHDGVVRDCIIRYANLKAGSEPYTSPFKKSDPFKTKLCAVQNLAIMYSSLEQKEDRLRRRNEGLVESAIVDIMEGKLQHELQDKELQKNYQALTCNTSRMKGQHEAQSPVSQRRLPRNLKEGTNQKVTSPIEGNPSLTV